MNSKCKGTCDKITEYETRNGVRGSYKMGFKRCRECEYFIMIDSIRCPCCNGILKARPRNNTCRRNLRESQTLIKEVSKGINNTIDSNRYDRTTS
jgi:hypothetical protein